MDAPQPGAGERPPAAEPCRICCPGSDRGHHGCDARRRYAGVDGARGALDDPGASAMSIPAGGIHRPLPKEPGGSATNCRPTGPGRSSPATSDACTTALCPAGCSMACCSTAGNARPRPGRTIWRPSSPGVTTMRCAAGFRPSWASWSTTRRPRRGSCATGVRRFRNFFPRISTGRWLRSPGRRA